MTLAHGTDRLESARLMLRRITPDDLPFFTRIHALPKVARHLYPGGRPRSRQETTSFLQFIFESYEQLALGYLAVLRKEDGALIGRCGLMELVVESAVPEHGLRKGWFGPPEAATGVALTYECELGYTFDPAVWGQGFPASTMPLAIATSGVFPTLSRYSPQASFRLRRLRPLPRLHHCYDNGARRAKRRGHGWQRS